MDKTRGQRLRVLLKYLPSLLPFSASLQVSTASVILVTVCRLQVREHSSIDPLRFVSWERRSLHGCYLRRQATLPGDQDRAQCHRAGPPHTQKLRPSVTPPL